MPGEEQKTPLRAVRFCTAMASHLHATGSSAMRLERRLEVLSAGLGVPGQFFATPTAIMAQYRLPEKRRPYADMVRSRPGGIDLGRQADLERIVDSVAAGRSSLSEGEARLAAVAAMPRSRWTGPVSAILISLAAARFLGGGVAEIAAAGIAGAVIGLLEVWAARHAATVRLVPPTAACAAAIAIAAAATVLPSMSASLALVACLIVLVPGLEFTVAVKEISTENLVSGSARLTSAMGDFLLLAFGVALGTQVSTRAFGAPLSGATVAAPGWTQWLALLVAMVGFGMRFRAHRRDFVWVGVACLVSWFGADVGDALLGPDIGVFVAALAVGLAANARGRWSGTSSTVMMIPGLILLVPGSFGLRAADLMLRDDPLSALNTMFSMLLIATALSTGLLLANLVLPTEKADGAVHMGQGSRSG